MTYALLILDTLLISIMVLVVGSIYWTDRRLERLGDKLDHRLDRLEGKLDVHVKQ